MKYFITGATGFIGGRVAHMLAQAGHEVIALARTPGKAGDLTKAGIRIHAGDVTDKESMRAGMAGVDGVYHIAGWYKLGVRDKAPGKKINVDGTRNVLELMRELNIPKGVYTSTLAVNSDTGGKLVDESYHFDGKHLSEYDQTKADAHKVADEFVAQGLPLVIVMPGMVYGPGDASVAHDLFANLLQGKLPLTPQVQAMCWAHVDDIAQGHILAMEKGKPGETYIIAGPPHTLIEAVEMAAKISGVPAPTMHPSPGMMKVMAGAMGLLEKVLPVPENYSGEYLLASSGVTYIGDNRKAKRELGYNPRSLDAGLRETLAWEQAQLEIKP